MDLDYSADQQALRATVRRLLADRAPIARLRELAGRAAPLDGAWRGLTELGVPALMAPEAQGGLDLGLVDMGTALEEAGRALYYGPLISSAVSGVLTVRLLGSETDHTDLLPSIADGTVVATLAHLEPGARYDWRAPQARADASRLTGTKCWVPDASVADLLLVVAQAEDGIAVFAVESDADGVSVTETPTYDVSRSFATVTLAGAQARRVGSGDAAAALVQVVDRTMLAYVVDGLGAAERALEMTLDYAQTREQFGRPIGSFQAVQHLCADMLQLLEMGRAGAHYALWAADSSDEAAAHLASTMACAWAADAFYQLGATAIQVFGGVGFTWEHDIGLYFKRLLTVAQVYGDTREHLEELASLII